jgi:hypothetical protein
MNTQTKEIFDMPEWDRNNFKSYRDWAEHCFIAGRLEQKRHDQEKMDKIITMIKENGLQDYFPPALLKSRL